MNRNTKTIRIFLKQLKREQRKYNSNKFFTCTGDSKKHGML